ncbi:hypothetical protein ACPA5B_03425 [Pseudomonas solani]|uniref:hypothetical protein n=1 Tax=Pseudomonas solani TaxID=2731552 RepID=UPI003C2E04E9
MASQDGGANVWEKALLGVIRNELEQLRYLIENKSGDTEPPDVHAQISRFGGLTDLAFAESLELSVASRAVIESMAREAEALVRNSFEFSQPDPDGQLENEQQAANAMYDAILQNLPYLAEGDRSQYAMALSKEVFSILQRHVGDRADFELVTQAVLVQDYRVMKLAGSS